MTITPLPTPAPSRLQSQTEFSANVNAFVGALPTLVTEINAMAPDIDAAGANAATATTKAAEAAVSAASALATAAAVGSAAGLPSFTGNAGKALQVNSGASGVEWAFPAETNYQAFTASGTWTKPDNCTMVYVECIGSGGGGATYPSSSFPVCGGAGGGFAFGTFLASILASTVTVTVGAGGAGAVIGVTPNGSDGGSSTFGSHLLAYGGRGGLLSSSSTTNTGGTIGGIVDGSGGGLGNALAGGNAAYGGGGGGGASSGTLTNLGGVSQRHGNGGAGSGSGGGGGNGVAPGGGGGGSYNGGNGGNGARGEIRIWAW